MIRHTACKICRNRKVRCDGNQPACSRCSRSLETCVYDSFSKPTKADLIQTVESLRARIDTAEAYMKQGQIHKSNDNNQSTSAAPGSSISIEYPNLMTFHTQLPNFLNYADQFLPSDPNVALSGQYHPQSVIPFGDNFENDFMNYLPNPPPTPAQNDAALQFQLENMRPPEEVLQNIVTTFNPGSEGNRPAPIPSLREIRAEKRSSSISSHISKTDSGGGEQEEYNRKIVSELMNFSSAIFAIHADLAGISSVVAEYLAWIRNSPGRMAYEVSTTNDANVLETLEKRVRELNEMAETRHQAAWRQMAGVLENIDGIGAQVRELERDTQKRIEEKKRFFEASYNVCRALPNQAN